MLGPLEAIPAVGPDGQHLQVQAYAIGDEEVDIAAFSDDRFSIVGLSDKIVSVSSVVLDALRRVQPDSGSVEFGMDIAVEAGQLTAMLVKGSATASIKVTLEWKKSSEPSSPSK